MEQQIEILNPLEHKDWNKWLAPFEKSCVFHTSNWARVLSESYQYRPLYFTARSNGEVTGLVPTMEVSSLVTGKRGVSLPFSDDCEPLTSDAVSLQELMDRIIAYGTEVGWKFLEMRGSYPSASSDQCSRSFYKHQLQLQTDYEQAFSEFRHSTQTNIKKACRNGVQITFSRTEEALREFYRLHCLTRKKHGIPPQPAYFFDKIYKYIMAADLGDVILASHENRNIAAGVCFKFGQKVLYKFNASDYNSQALRANNLIMWNIYKHYATQGYKLLCFGRTSPNSDGLRQWKNGWRTEETDLHYFRFDFNKTRLVKEDYSTNGLATRLFHRMPIPLLRMFGKFLYRHVG